MAAQISDYAAGQARRTRRYACPRFRLGIIDELTRGTAFLSALRRGPGFPPMADRDARFSFEGLATLYRSIRKHGLTLSAEVAPDGAGNRFAQHTWHRTTILKVSSSLFRLNNLKETSSVVVFVHYCLHELHKKKTFVFSSEPRYRNSPPAKYALNFPFDFP